MEKYNEKLSKLAGLFSQVASEISNDTTLLRGEKFLILQRLVADITPALKAFEEVKKEMEEYAKIVLLDNGTGKSDEIKFEGASLLVKYSYPKPMLDGELLALACEQAYAEIGTPFEKDKFLKESTPRKSVVIQSILEK
jgi:hypothetical protein